MRILSSFISAYLLATAVSHAAVINEVLIEPSGGPIGQQFFELRGAPGESLTGLSFVVLIGEEGGSGIVDQVLDLSSFTLGPNGLLLWRDVPAPTLAPPPEPGTTLVTGGLFLPAFFGNISQTFALVEGFTASPGDDLDLDNDGILDATPWTAVEDAIGVRESDGTPGNEFAFGTQMGFTDFPVTGFNPDLIFRETTTQGWIASDVDNTPGGPYTFDAIETVDIDLNPQPLARFDITTATPGAANASVPEPSAIVLLSCCLVSVILRRRMFH